MMRNVLISLLLLGISSFAQVVELSGGSSSQLGANGGSVQLFFPNTTLMLSAGMNGSHFAEGVALTSTIKNLKWTLGDTFIPLGVPTDFNSAQGIASRGLSIDRKTSLSELAVFGGETASQTGTSLFDATQVSTPAGMLFYIRLLGDHFIFNSTNVFSRQQTSIQALTYQAHVFSLAASGGIGSNEPFLAGLFNLHTTKFDLKLGYTESSKTFHRIALPNNYYSTENSGLNVSTQIRPTDHWNLSASHQNLSSVLNHTYEEATSSDESVSYHYASFDASGNVFQGSYKGLLSLGQSASVSDTFFSRVLTVQGEYFRSAFVHSYMETFRERLNRHFSVSEFVTEQGGHMAVNFGGDFTSNPVSVSAGWNMQFTPFVPNEPFQKVFTITLRTHLPFNSNFNGSVMVLHGSPALYTASGNQFSEGHKFNGQSALKSTHAALQYKNVVRGVVLDSKGDPVSGAAIQIGSHTLFTDSNGAFLLRQKHAGSAPLNVKTSEFSVGTWRVIQAPKEVMITAPATEIVVTVQSCNPAVNH